MGGFDRTVNDVPSLDVRFGSSAYTSGTKGGHNIYLRKFARDGVILLGKLEAASGTRLTFTDDLQDSLNDADEYARRWRAGPDWVSYRVHPTGRRASTRGPWAKSSGDERDSRRSWGHPIFPIGRSVPPE